MRNLSFMAAAAFHHIHGSVAAICEWGGTVLEWCSPHTAGSAIAKLVPPISAVNHRPFGNYAISQRIGPLTPIGLPYLVAVPSSRRLAQPLIGFLRVEHGLIQAIPGEKGQAELLHNSWDTFHERRRTEWEEGMPIMKYYIAFSVALAFGTLGCASSEDAPPAADDAMYVVEGDVRFLNIEGGCCEGERQEKSVFGRKLRERPAERLSDFRGYQRRLRIQTGSVRQSSVVHLSSD